jgi:hypothetical protein
MALAASPSIAIDLLGVPAVPTSLLPSLLTSVMHAPASALGLIEGFSDAAAGLANFVSGTISDDPGRRRRVAVGGYTTTAVLSAAIEGCRRSLSGEDLARWGLTPSRTRWLRIFYKLPNLSQPYRTVNNGG